MTRRVLAGLVPSLAISLWLLSTGLVAQAPADPWTRVPPFPATCYRGEDFSGPADKATAALDAAIERQNSINAGIEKEYQEMDMAVMAQRMQAFMLKDPQRAMAIMQAGNAAGASANTSVQRSAVTAEKLAEELSTHTAKFQAAVDGVRRPLLAQIDQLIKAKSVPTHVTVAFGTAADEAQYLGLMNRLNTDYDKICAAWWGPTGTFQTWLQALKTHVVNDLIAPDDQIAAAKALQFAIMETPTAAYRPTAEMLGVREYLRRARGVYELRPHKEAVPKSAR